MNAEVQHAHDMGVHQVGDSARLGEEAISVVNCQFGVEYLDGDLRSQVDMLAQIDVCESSTINQANDAIVANVLHCAVRHAQCSDEQSTNNRSVLAILEASCGRVKEIILRWPSCAGYFAYPFYYQKVNCHVGNPNVIYLMRR